MQPLFVIFWYQGSWSAVKLHLSPLRPWGLDTGSLARELTLLGPAAPTFWNKPPRPRAQREAQQRAPSHSSSESYLIRGGTLPPPTLEASLADTSSESGRRGWFPCLGLLCSAYNRCVGPHGSSLGPTRQALHRRPHPRVCRPGWVVMRT